MCFTFISSFYCHSFPIQATRKRSTTTKVLIYPIKLINLSYSVFILLGSKISVLFLVQQFLCLILWGKGKEGETPN